MIVWPRGGAPSDIDLDSFVERGYRLISNSPIYEKIATAVTITRVGTNSRGPLRMIDEPNVLKARFLS